MSNDAMNWAYDQKAGSRLNKSVLVALANQANKAGRCWPSINYIAGRLEASRRGVIKCLNTLEEIGLITRLARGGNGTGRKSNVYKLPIDQITLHAEQRALIAHSRKVHSGVGQSALDDMQCALNAPKQSINSKKNNHSLTKSRGFDKWFPFYPKQVKEKEARAIWIRKNLESMTDELIADIKTKAQKDRQWLEGYAPDPTTYLNGERWDDEIIPPREKANGQSIPYGAGELAAYALREGLSPAPPGMSAAEYRQKLQTEKDNREAPP